MALAKPKLTQKEVAKRSGLEQATVSDIVNDRSHPRFDTVERMVKAIGTTFGELFDEPRIQLSAEDAELGRTFAAVLDRLLQNDAAQKTVAQTGTSIPARRRRTRKTSSGSGPTTSSTTIELRDASNAMRNQGHEVENLPNEIIPEWHYRMSARRAYRVLTDSMIGIGILQGAVVYVRPTIDVAAADGEIIICMLNGTLYLKRLDLRGRTKSLESANPRYPALLVTDSDTFALAGIVVMKPT
jgi:SOS-response transcriptional repressor LexA